MCWCVCLCVSALVWYAVVIWWWHIPNKYDKNKTWVSTSNILYVCVCGQLWIPKSTAWRISHLLVYKMYISTQFNTVHSTTREYSKYTYTKNERIKYNILSNFHNFRFKWKETWIKEKRKNTHNVSKNFEIYRMLFTFSFVSQTYMIPWYTDMSISINHRIPKNDEENA